jgi:hypothetical protein
VCCLRLRACCSRPARRSPGRGPRLSAPGSRRPPLRHHRACPLERSAAGQDTSRRRPLAVPRKHGAAEESCRHHVSDSDRLDDRCTAWPRSRDRPRRSPGFLTSEGHRRGPPRWPTPACPRYRRRLSAGRSVRRCARPMVATSHSRTRPARTRRDPGCRRAIADPGRTIAATTWPRRTASSTTPYLLAELAAASALLLEHLPLGGAQPDRDALLYDRTRGFCAAACTTWVIARIAARAT